MTPMMKLISSYGDVSLNSSQHNLWVTAYFPTSTHFVKREYLLYMFDSFVADVGGCLGLLLGHRQDKISFPC